VAVEAISKWGQVEAARRLRAGKDFWGGDSKLACPFPTSYGSGGAL